MTTVINAAGKNAIIAFVAANHKNFANMTSNDVYCNYVIEAQDVLNRGYDSTEVSISSFHSISGNEERFVLDNSFIEEVNATNEENEVEYD